MYYLCKCIIRNIRTFFRIYCKVGQFKLLEMQKKLSQRLRDKKYKSVVFDYITLLMMHGINDRPKTRKFNGVE
jgi:hypothetical protein